MTITWAQWLAEITATGIPAWAIDEPADVVFMPMESRWLLEDFHRWYFRSLDALEIRSFDPERGDCDDFSGLFCVFARILHRRSAEGKGYASPVAWLNLSLRPELSGQDTQRHRCVCARTRDRGLLFIEPQVLGKVYQFTVPQLSSCTKFSPG
jgi:hypothetical protein